MAPNIPSTGCGWFMVPPGLTAQIAHALEFNFTPDIATPEYLCGSRAELARKQGLQEYSTKAAAQAAADAANASAAPATQSGPSIPGLAQIGDFFHRLTEANTWIRVGEFAFGAILLYVGVKAMFPNQVNAVTAPVKKAAKVAAII